MSIEFDFDEYDDAYPGELTEDNKQEASDSVLGEVFEVESEDELADVISDQTGWCIKTLNYRRVYA